MTAEPLNGIREPIPPLAFSYLPGLKTKERSTFNLLTFNLSIFNRMDLILKNEKIFLPKILCKQPSTQSAIDPRKKHIQLNNLKQLHRDKNGSIFNLEFSIFNHKQSFLEKLIQIKRTGTNIQSIFNLKSTSEPYQLSTRRSG